MNTSATTPISSSSDMPKSRNIAARPRGLLVRYRQHAHGRDDVRWLSYGQPRPAHHPGSLRLDTDFRLGVFLARLFGQDEWGQFEQTGGPQLVETGQFVQTVEPKMDEKTRRRHPEERPAGAGAPPLGAHPAGLHQCIDRSLAESDPPDLFDFGAGYRLVVRNDRKSFDCSPRQLAGDRPLDAQAGGEIGR